jgi:hypothetical protein
MQKYPSWNLINKYYNYLCIYAYMRKIMKNVIFIACGSSASWILKNIIYKPKT